ncbi:hypothetical protein ACOMHN_060359 [Nucella lapillus]
MHHLNAMTSRGRSSEPLSDNGCVLPTHEQADAQLADDRSPEASDPLAPQSIMNRQPPAHQSARMNSISSDSIFYL